MTFSKEQSVVGLLESTTLTATSTSQVREVNMELEEGGEQEWVFTLRHSHQVTEDVSLSLTHQ